MGANNAAAIQNGQSEQAEPSTFQMSAYSDVESRSHPDAGSSNLRYLSEDELADPTQTQQLATNADQINENYPFFGTLLKKKEGGRHFRRKEDIPKADPMTIEQVEDIYGPGVYKLRLTGKGGQVVDELQFSIEDSSPEPQPDPQNEFERRSKQKEANTYEKMLELNERRIQSLQQELDQKSRKVRELNEEISAIERRSDREKRQMRERLETKVDDLKEKLRETQRELDKKELDLKFSGREGTVEKLIDRIMSNDGLLSQIAPFIQQAMQAKANGDGVPALNGTTQNGQRPNPQPESRNPSPHQPANIHQHPQAATPDGQGSDSEDEDTDPGDRSISQQPQRQNPQQENNDMSPQQAQVDPQQVKNQFVQALTQRGKQALKSANPDQADIIDTVETQLDEIQQKGFPTVHPTVWIEISRNLVQHAQQHEIGPEKVADVVGPLLDNMDKAKSILQQTPANMAVGLLETTFGFSCQPAEKELLKQVLTVFKERI